MEAHVAALGGRACGRGWQTQARLALLLPFEQKLPAKPVAQFFDGRRRGSEHFDLLALNLALPVLASRVTAQPGFRALFNFFSLRTVEAEIDQAGQRADNSARGEIQLSTAKNPL